MSVILSSSFGPPNCNKNYHPSKIGAEKLCFMEKLFAIERPHEFPHTELIKYMRTVIGKLSSLNVELTYKESYAITMLNMYIEEWERFAAECDGKRKELFEREDSKNDRI